MKTNLGYIYNKEFFTWLIISKKCVKETGSNKLKYYYYPDLTKQVQDANKKKKKTVDSEFGKFNKKFLGFQLERADVNDFVDKFEENQTIKGFQLKTIYPGLLSGSGYLHEVGEKNDDEFQLGFYFDYTTGLPVIPASSIKGVLRYACEMRDGEYLKDIIKRLGIDVPNFDTKKFIKTVFEGKTEIEENGKKKEVGISIYKRDIFHDAFPIKSEKSLFGMDYITHHEHPLKNPNPVKFLRVQPEVTYKFQFDLKPTNDLTVKQKKEIFEQIILDLGLGAKTNVGYGQFEKVLKENSETERFNEK